MTDFIDLTQEEWNISGKSINDINETLEFEFYYYSKIFDKIPSTLRYRPYSIYIPIGGLTCESVDKKGNIIYITDNFPYHDGNEKIKIIDTNEPITYYCKPKEIINREEAHKRFENCIILRTRMGGGNAEDFKEEIKFMRNHKWYIAEFESWDITYRLFVYKIPNGEEKKLLNI